MQMSANGTAPQSEKQPTALEQQVTGLQNAVYEASGVLLNENLLTEVVAGIEAGRAWMKQRYNLETTPNVYIGEHAAAMSGLNGLAIGESGEMAIGIQVSSLVDLQSNSHPETDLVKQNYGEGIPIEPQLTVKQVYEVFMVGSLVHWLQVSKKEGFVDLSQIQGPNPATPESRGGTYMNQPSQREALRICGEYMQDTYGTNPLNELEDYLDFLKWKEEG